MARKKRASSRPNEVGQGYTVIGVYFKCDECRHYSVIKSKMIRHVEKKHGVKPAVVNVKAIDLVEVIAEPIKSIDDPILAHLAKDDSV